MLTQKEQNAITGREQPLPGEDTPADRFRPYHPLTKGMTMQSVEEYDAERAERQRRADLQSIDELRSHVDTLVQENDQLRESGHKLKAAFDSLKLSFDDLALRNGELLRIQDKLAKTLGEQTCPSCYCVIGSPTPYPESVCRCRETRKVLAMVKGR